MNEAERIRWAKALWLAGWSFLLAYLFILVSLVRRASAINEASFEDGLWWQRVEQVSSAATPQNLIVLVPGAAATLIGIVLARPIVDRTVIWLSQLIRLVAGVNFVVIAIAGLGIIGVFFRNYDGIADLQSLLLRLGGIAMAAAMVRLCFEAERSS